ASGQAATAARRPLGLGRGQERDERTRLLPAGGARRSGCAVPPSVGARRKTRCGRRRPLAPERDELQALVAALDGLLEHGPDSANVELVVDDAGLERRPLLRQQSVARRRVRDAHRSVQADDAEVILGVTLVELLAARPAGSG